MPGFPGFPSLWCPFHVLLGKHHAIPKSRFMYRAPSGWVDSENRSLHSSTNPFPSINSPSLLPTPTGLCLHYLNAAGFWSPVRVRSTPSPSCGATKGKRKEEHAQKALSEWDKFSFCCQFTLSDTKWFWKQQKTSAITESSAWLPNPLLAAPRVLHIDHCSQSCT